MLCNDTENDIILIADPKILRVPIIESNEPMIDLKNQHEVKYGPSPEIENNTDYTKMRKSVYEKIVIAQTQLPKGIYFCIYECYRSLQLQKMLFEDKFALVKAQHPDWTHEQLFIETTHLVSPVINLDGTKNIPPHSTGGAFDIYLVDSHGNYLEMGIHPKDWMLDDGSFSLTHSTCISDIAKENRRIMCEVLNAVGFVNYPTEFWHWSYGDRYWAYHKKQPHAIYNSIL